MPVATEKRQPSIARAHMARLKKLVNINPGERDTNNPVEPYDVFNPHPHLYVLSWSRRQNVNRKKRDYFAQTVTAEDGVKLYKLHPDQVDKGDNTCGHPYDKDVVLLRYPKAAWDRRMALGPLQALIVHNDDLESYGLNAPARNLDSEGRVIHDNPLVTKRQVFDREGGEEHWQEQRAQAQAARQRARRQAAEQAAAAEAQVMKGNRGRPMRAMRVPSDLSEIEGNLSAYEQTILTGTLDGTESRIDGVDEIGSLHATSDDDLEALDERASGE